MSIKTVQAVINGQVVTLTFNSVTGKYEAQLTAPAASSFNLSGGYYPVTVKATDTAGNETTADSTHSTLGSSLKLYVKEQVKPTVTILSPSAGAYVTTGTPEIKFKVLDNTVQTSGYSGIKKDSCKITVGSNIVTDGITWADTEGGYIGTFTPPTALADGEQTIKIDIKDNDGNSAETASCTFKIDTVAPSLTVAAPAEGFETNKSELTVSGATDDATGKPVTVNIKLNGTDCGAVTVGEDGSFSKKITLTQQGENTIVITATDKAGKTTTVTRKVTFNTTAPVIKSVTITPNPVNAGSFTLTAVPDSGYVFDCWSDDANNKSATRTLSLTDANLTSAADVKTYTAVFKKISAPYTVKFSKGSVSGSGSMGDISRPYGESFVLPKNEFTGSRIVMFDPNHDGLSSENVKHSAEFLGWEDHGSITASNGEVFSPEQFDAPFYANKYGDLFNAFGYNKQNLVNHWANYGRNEGRQCTGTPRGVYPDQATVNALADEGGATVLRAQWAAFPSFAMPTPEREGYRFLGWYTEAEGGTKVGDGGASYTSDANRVLYAHWESAAPKFTAASIIYAGKQVSEQNKVPAGEGYLISVGIN